jgi:outer membrane protein OmpA-like peptidoglycan-associated protein
MAQVESMTPDLMGIVNRQITPDIIRSAASQLGEDRERTASALSTSVPSVLTALSDVASSDTGAAHLKEAVDEKRHASSREPNDLASLLRAGSGHMGTTDHHGHAATLLEDELGPRSSTIADAVARTSGIRSDSARKIMGGITGVAVAAIGKVAGGTGSSSLRTMLRSQRGEWVSRLPAPVASLFDGGSAGTARYEQGQERGYERTSTVERVVTGPAIREIEAPHQRRAWLIPAIIAVLALLAIPFIRGLRRTSAPQTPQVTQAQPATPSPPPPAPAPVEKAQPPVAAAPAPAPEPTPAPAAEPTPAPAAAAPTPAPAAAAPTPAPAAQPLAPAPTHAPMVAVQPAAPPATTQDLAAFVAGTEGTTPRRFALQPLNFQLGSTTLTRDSVLTVDDLAGVLNADPAATIRIESYTDDAGTPEANQRITTARSETIKSLLIARGVDPSRVEAAGMGATRPVASNDTAEGRAQNRRTDVIVTAR